ncbi:MAG: protein kinase [Cyanobacteria bacterium SZAS-4]|nr:protein kinase [Cyanobacteria bacterium SZAS-4]
MRISQSKIQVTDGTAEPASAEITSGKRTCPACNVAVHKALSTCPNDGTVIEEPPAFKRSFAGKYQFVAQIGSGGMGVIYKAKQPLLDRYYAIKMLNVQKANQRMLARFHQEAKAASTLNHPNVISVHDFGFTDDDDPYMVMDFVEGMSLAALLQSGGAIPYKEALGIFIQIATGMNHAHILGVLHRDLKPSNVMLTNPESVVAEVKIVDFGIAKINKAEESSSLTQTGDVFGSPLYMSPEQASGMKVDARSDIYSLGCLMYEVLTGAPPLQADTIIQTMFLHLNQMPMTMSEMHPSAHFPESLEYVVRKCLEKDPSLRYQSMLDLKVDLVKVSVDQPIREQKYAAFSKTPSAIFKLNWLQIAVAILAFAAASYTIFERREMSVESERREAQARSIEQKFTSDLRSIGSEPLSGIDGETFVKQEVAQGKSVISFPGLSADDSALKYIEGNPNIISLSMRANDISREGFTHLKFPNLKRLDVQETEITPELMTALLNLPKLDHLNLSKTRYTRSSLTQISTLKYLRSLNLCRSNLSDDDCQIIARMTNLEQLRIGFNPQITDKGINALKALTNLTALDLNNTSVSDKGLTVLKSLNKLQDLQLYQTHISDDGVKTLAKMPLKRLSLSDTMIGSKSIQYLSKMSQIKYLEIHQNPQMPLQLQRYLQDKMAAQGAFVKIDRGAQR